MSDQEMVSIEVPRAMAEAMLESAISEFSEDCYCAGWMSGIQDDLWDILDGEEPAWGYGMCGGTPDDERLARIRALRDATGIWFCGYRDPCSVEEYRFSRGFAVR